MRLVGVHPGAELRLRPRLWAALSLAFPEVRFEAREASELAGLDALVELGGAAQAEAAAATGIRALAALSPERDRGEPRPVEFAANGGLDRRLRGQTLPDRHLGEQPVLAEPGATVLASVGGAPVWTRAGRLDVVSVAAAELADAEPLRGRLGGERSLALLPLVELLRELTRDGAWQPPPPRAAFLLDDPNLRWPSYGFLSLPRLDRHAGEHGYHLALAMVPLDARVTHRGAVGVLRDGGAISLCVHGNDHFGDELGRVRGEAEALALAAQAQRRIAAFERRTGVPVSPVMVPPHEECSEAMAAAMARTGFAAASMTRPFPWLSPPPRHWLTAPDAAAALAGWSPADIGPGGLPVLLRHPLADPHFVPAEVVLRAYLDQPLILYGHHDDLADGLDVLAERSAFLAGIGPVRWGSLDALASANVHTRREGDLLRLRPYTREMRVDLPDGVERLTVEPPWDAEGEAVEFGGRALPTGEPFAAGERAELVLRLRRADAVSVADVAPPPRRPWPLARRLAAEARDRAAPARRRLRAGARAA
jgi:hypothetical protein